MCDINYGISQTAQKRINFVPKYFRRKSGFSLTKAGGLHIIYEDMVPGQVSYRKSEKQKCRKGTLFPPAAYNMPGRENAAVKQGKEELL